MTFRIGRRATLRSLTGAAIGLPLLNATGCTRPDGSVVEARRDALELSPKRAFVMIVPNGTDQERFFPSAVRSPTDFDLGPCMQTTELATPPSVTLESLKSKLTILDGVDNQPGMEDGGGHEAGAVTLLTGRRREVVGDNAYTSTGPSFDRLLGEHIRAHDPAAPANLVLSIGTNSATGWAGQMSYTSAGAQASKIRGPVQLFEQLFAALEEPSVAERRRTRRSSILDGALGSYRRLRDRVGGEDRRRLDDHLAQIREVEQRLQAGVRDCSSPTPVESNGNDSNDLPAIFDHYRRLVGLAFACDLTRVVTFVVRSEGGQTRYVFPWLSFYDHCDMEGERCLDRRSGTASRNHHEMSHFYNSNDAVRRDYLEVQQWHLGKFAELAGELDAIEENGRTVLDNSVCVYTSSLGYGNHGTRRVPVLMAGSLGESLQAGRAASYDGASLNDVWLSVMRGFGMEDATFGDPAYSTGPLSGLLA